MVYSAAFLSGLAKIETKENSSLQKAWRPKYVFNYIQDRYFNPDFVVDITNVFDKKIEAIKAYKTQFYNPDSVEPSTFISSPEFLKFVEARAVHFGMPIGAKYAEAFTLNRTPGVEDIVTLL